jgi:hypothetical protein
MFEQGCGCSRKDVMLDEEACQEIADPCSASCVLSDIPVAHRGSAGNRHDDIRRCPDLPQPKPILTPSWISIALEAWEGGSFCHFRLSLTEQALDPGCEKVDIVNRFKNGPAGCDWTMSFFPSSRELAT